MAHTNKTTDSKRGETTTPPQHPTPRIKELVIEELFGYITHRLRGQTDEGFGHFNIFYGDNGAGKTTILNLIFALLSVERNQGDKTYLATIPFRRVRIVLSSGDVVEAFREMSSDAGSYRVSIGQRGETRETFEIQADSEGHVRLEVNPDVPKLFRKLEELKLPITYLLDSRAVKRSVPEGTAGAPFRRRVWLSSERNRPDRGLPTSREQFVELVRTAERWIDYRTISGSASGAEDVNAVYTSLLGRLSKVKSESGSGTKGELDKRLKRLSEVARRVEEYASLGLSVAIAESEVAGLLRATTIQARPMVFAVVDAYLNSAEARLTALTDIRDVISTLQRLLGSFFTRKTVSISPRTGIRIVAPGPREIAPELLSSGEIQLLSILLHTTLARETGGLFLIDEPELSLNIKWQRRLVEALTAFPSSGSLQFLIASHSLEILTKQRKYTIEI